MAANEKSAINMATQKHPIIKNVFLSLAKYDKNISMAVVDTNKYKKITIIYWPIIG